MRNPCPEIYHLDAKQFCKSNLFQIPRFTGANELLPNVVISMVINNFHGKVSLFHKKNATDKFGDIESKAWKSCKEIDTDANLPDSLH